MGTHSGRFRPRSEGRTALEQLRALLGEPACWGSARPAIWDASELYLGFRLPADLKAFLDLYDPGSVDGYLTINRPMDTTPAELERYWGPPPERPAWYGEIADGCWEVDESDVRSGVLLPWGSDEHGSRYFFRASRTIPPSGGSSSAVTRASGSRRPGRSPSSWCAAFTGSTIPTSWTPAGRGPARATRPVHDPALSVPDHYPCVGLSEHAVRRTCHHAESRRSGPSPSAANDA